VNDHVVGRWLYVAATVPDFFDAFQAAVNAFKVILSEEKAVLTIRKAFGVS
jgi:hypothetical protein